jgi:hypothetical protein
VISFDLWWLWQALNSARQNKNKTSNCERATRILVLCMCCPPSLSSHYPFPHLISSHVTSLLLVSRSAGSFVLVLDGTALASVKPLCCVFTHTLVLWMTGGSSVLVFVPIG